MTFLLLLAKHESTQFETSVWSIRHNEAWDKIVNKIVNNWFKVSGPRFHACIVDVFLKTGGGFILHKYYTPSQSLDEDKA